MWFIERKFSELVSISKLNNKKYSTEIISKIWVIDLFLTTYQPLWGYFMLET